MNANANVKERERSFKAKQREIERKVRIERKSVLKEKEMFGKIRGKIESRKPKNQSLVFKRSVSDLIFLFLTFYLCANLYCL